MKTRNQSTKALQVLGLQAALLILVGCGGGGGGSGDGGGSSSGSGGGGSTPSPQPVVASVQVGVPVCSTVGSGSVNGRVFSGNTGYVDVSPDCTASAARMRVWLQVNVGGATVDHYDWKILSWRNQVPHGTLTNYASVVDINSASSRYIVRTSGNRIRYDSTTIQELLRLTGTFQQTIEVTAWTREGRFANAYFTVRLNAGGGDGGGGGSTINGSLTGSDAASHARVGCYADYYRLTGSGTTIISMTGFDSYLYLYDDQLQLITSDDDGAGNLGSRITYTLASGRTYYLEATSYTAGETGNYQLAYGGGSMTQTTSPWGGEGGNGPSLVVSDGFRPHLSPDRSRVVFTRLVGSTSGGYTEIWIVNLDGSGARRLASAAGSSDYSPQWTPGGQMIGFLRKSGTHLSQSPGTLWTVSPDGSNARARTQITGIRDFCFYTGTSDPTLLAESEDGDLWLSSGTVSSFSGWWLRRRGGSDPRGAVQPSGGLPDVAIWDGTLLGVRGAIVFNPGDLDETLVDNAGRFPWPSLSPSGTKVIAGADGGVGNGIYSMNLNGSGLTRLTTITTSGMADHQPSWAGDTVVFVRMPNGSTPLEHGSIYRITGVRE